MRVEQTSLEDVLLIEPRIFGDTRGAFHESYQRERYHASGVDVDFVQDNLSRSTTRVLRGLHYQYERPQAKLVQVLLGCVFDVAVDLRRSSKTFGHWCGWELSGENHRQLYLPVGFAHGFAVLSAEAVVSYKCSDYYDPASERTLIWNDSQVGIEWPVDGQPLLSEKDERGQPFESLDLFS